MTASTPLRFVHRTRPGPGGASVLRLALRWSVYLLVFLGLGVSVRMALISYESVAPTLRATASGLSTACSVLASAGICDPLYFIDLS